ncbi:hypothetical protein KR009_006821 [Drosophila setifemur]|nr:hypothetical protein KR009_006821 [Drosophila setifemur]
MGVIYKILKQQRSGMDLSLSSATRCKVQAAIKQRQQQRRLEDQHQHQDGVREQELISLDQPADQTKEELAEQQLQQLCRFLAENAARKKRQRFKLQYQCEIAEDQDQDHDLDQEQEQESGKEQYSPPPHEMEMDFIDQLRQSSPATSPHRVNAPRDSILLKIRHQIFERKRQRQRQLAELVQQRLVVWRPW